MLSAAVSVAAFSVVLSETFAAVGLSSLIPASFVTFTKLTKELATATPPSASVRRIRPESWSWWVTGPRLLTRMRRSLVALRMSDVV